MATLDDVEGPLEPLEYLARSPSRVKVLDAIAENPSSRRDLEEVTEASRVTLSRILSNLEDRGWIQRTNGAYEATPRGKVVAGEVTTLLANFRTLEHLDGTLEWLPTEAFTFDLTCLRDANVETADWTDHTAQIRRVADLIDGSDRILATASGVSRDVLAALRDAAIDDGATVTAVLDSTALAVVADDPELAAQAVTMLESETVELYRYEGDAEPLLMVTVCDDTVILCGHDQDGPPPGTLDTTNDQVRAWAETYVESVREESRPVEPDAFRG